VLIVKKEKTMQKFSGVIVRLLVFLFCFGLLIPAAQSQTRKKAVAKKPAARFLPIPNGTEIKIRLDDEIDTKKSRDGDRFTATVLSPSKYADATVEGHIAKIDESGKLTGKTELALSFDRIRLRNGQSGRMAAQVVKVYGEDSVKEVDEEGNVKSGSKGKRPPSAPVAAPGSARSSAASPAAAKARPLARRSARGLAQPRPPFRAATK
jgi:hypothetical protein